MESSSIAPSTFFSFSGYCRSFAFAYKFYDQLVNFEEKACELYTYTYFYIHIKIYEYNICICYVLYVYTLYTYNYIYIFHIRCHNLCPHSFIVLKYFKCLPRVLLSGYVIIIHFP